MIILESGNRFWIGSAVQLITEDRDLAWAERSYYNHPALKHFVGRFVEADRANSNRQLWTLADLQTAYNTIKGTPVNWSHNPRRCMGSYIDAELLYPKNEAAVDDLTNPFVETLGVLWPYNFPEEMTRLEEAHAEGTLMQSMECVSKTVTCAGPSGCGAEYEYRGPRDASYCDCLRDGPGYKQLNSPTFLGGGLLVPPVMPGWGNAKVNDFATLMQEHADQMENVYNGVAAEFPHLEPKQWEVLMNQVMVLASVGT